MSATGYAGRRRQLDADAVMELPCADAILRAHDLPRNREAGREALAGMMEVHQIRRDALAGRYDHLVDGEAAKAADAPAPGDSQPESGAQDGEGSVADSAEDEPDMPDGPEYSKADLQGMSATKVKDLAERVTGSRPKTKPDAIAALTEV